MANTVREVIERRVEEKVALSHRFDDAAASMGEDPRSVLARIVCDLCRWAHENKKPSRNGADFLPEVAPRWEIEKAAIELAVTTPNAAGELRRIHAEFRSTVEMMRPGALRDRAKSWTEYRRNALHFSNHLGMLWDVLWAASPIEDLKATKRQRHGPTTGEVCEAAHISARTWGRICDTAGVSRPPSGGAGAGWTYAHAEIELAKQCVLNDPHRRNRAAIAEALTKLIAPKRPPAG